MKSIEEEGEKEEGEKEEEEEEEEEEGTRGWHASDNP